MIINKPSITLDKHGQEIIHTTLPSFNLSAYNTDINTYLNGFIPWHWHRELEFFFLTKGVVQIGIRNDSYILKEGEGCFINSEVLHSFFSKASIHCKYKSFVFAPEIIGGAPGSIFDTAYVQPTIKNGPAFIKFSPNGEDLLFFDQFDHAFLACEKENPGYEFTVRNALSNILLHIKEKSKILPSQTISSIQENRIKQMLSFIDEHISANITVNDIANSANICVRECQRCFQYYLHSTPISYLQHQRVYYAAKLLALTDEDVTNIALQCGFSNLSYFCKQFRLILGITPRDYRKNHRSQ